MPGEVRRRLAHAVIRVIEGLVPRGAEGVILGCTEIELFIGADDSPVPTLSTTHLHAAAALDAALAAVPVSASTRPWRPAQAQVRKLKSRLRS